MANRPRRGLMAMEGVEATGELGKNADDPNSIASTAPMENAVYIRPVNDDPFNLFASSEEPVQQEVGNLLGEDLTPGEFPETMDEDIHLIATLESQLNDLRYLEADIRRTGGMNQHFALEAQKIVPDFGGVPVNYYTEAPTATRYRVALEELSRNVWAALAAGIAVILAALAKLVFWILGKRKKGDGGSGGGSETASASDVKEAVKVVEKMPAQVKEMAKAMDAGQQATDKAEAILQKANLHLKNEHGREFAVRNLQDLIDNLLTSTERHRYSERFLVSRTAYIHDIITNGDFTKELMELVNKSSSIANAITLKVGAMEKVIRKDLGSGSAEDEMANSAELSVIKRPVNVSIGGQEMTLGEAAKKIVEKQQLLKDQLSEKPITFDKLFTTMAKAYQSHTIDVIMRQAKDVMDCVGFVAERMEKMSQAARGVHTDGTPGAMSEGIGSEFRVVLSFVKEEGNALKQIMSVVTYYFEQLQMLADHALAFGIEVVAKTTSAMKKQKKDIPEGWKEVSADLHEQRQAILKAYKAMKNR